MNLQDDLLKQFADAVNSSGGGSKTDRTVYATVSRKENDLIYIKIDGSELETPAETMVEVGAGDKVFATIKDHSVVITGNISYPSLTRVGEVYITLRADGLLVGRLDKTTNIPIGSYIVIGTEEITIYNENHEALSSFGANTIELGKKSSALIKFCDGKAVIQLDDGTLRISGGNSVDAIGLSNTYGTYRSEVVCEAKSSSKRVGMQLLNGNAAVSSVIASENGVAVTVPSNKALTVNGKEVVKVDGVIAIGTVFINNVSIPKLSERYTTISVSPPTGYTLAGVCSWSLGEYNSRSISIHAGISAIWTDGNKIYMKIDNYHQTSGLSIFARIKWFAIRTTGNKSGGDQTIPF